MTQAANLAAVGSIATSTGKTAYPGALLQVVQVTQATQVFTTSNTMVSTGIGASITPSSASSKILVLVQASITSQANCGSGLAIARGATIVWNPSVSDANGFYGAMLNANTTRTYSSLQYLDSPATTSPTTYNLYFSSRSSGTTAVSPSDSTNGGTCIVLMEIAG